MYFNHIFIYQQSNSFREVQTLSIQSSFPVVKLKISAQGCISSQLVRDHKLISERPLKSQERDSHPWITFKQQKMTSSLCNVSVSLLCYTEQLSQHQTFIKEKMLFYCNIVEAQGRQRITSQCEPRNLDCPLLEESDCLLRLIDYYFF